MDADYFNEELPCSITYNELIQKLSQLPVCNKEQLADRGVEGRARARRIYLLREEERKLKSHLQSLTNYLPHSE